MGKSKRPSLLLASLFCVALIGAAPPSTRLSDMTVTIVSSNGQIFSSRGRLRAHDLRVRFEPEGSEEIDLYDFGRSEGVRIFPNDKIYFESRLSPARTLKAALEGWAPAPSTYPEKKILLKEGTFKGEAARLFLVVLEEKEKKSYSLRWVSADEAARPLQIVYPATDYETVIIDYDPLPSERYDPAQFEPPPGFLSVNPY